MSAPALPYVAGAVVEHLRDMAPLLAVPADRIATRPPVDVTDLHLVVQLAGNYPLTVWGGVYRPLVQVEARALAVDDDDAEHAVMVTAGRVAAMLAGAINRPWSTVDWSTDRVIDGPTLAPVDYSRPQPLHRALVRAELTVHAGS